MLANLLWYSILILARPVISESVARFEQKGKIIRLVLNLEAGVKGGSKLYGTLLD